MALSYIIFEV